MDAIQGLRVCPHCNCFMHLDHLNEHIARDHPQPLDVFDASARDVRCLAKSNAVPTKEVPANLSANDRYSPLFDESRDGFQTPKSVEVGMRGKYQMCRR